MSILRPRPKPEGSVWDVPAMSPDAWSRQPRDVWRAVAEEALRLGYHDACRRATGIHGLQVHADGCFLTFPVAMTAAELGAPIGQLFTACLLRRRQGQ